MLSYSMMETIDFKDSFTDKFIDIKSKQYYLPKTYLMEIITDLDDSGFDILNHKDRKFLEDYLAVTAIHYHRGK